MQAQCSTPYNSLSPTTARIHKRAHWLVTVHFAKLLPRFLIHRSSKHSENRSHSGSPLAVPAAFASGRRPSDPGHVLRYTREVTMAWCELKFSPPDIRKLRGERWENWAQSFLPQLVRDWNLYDNHFDSKQVELRFKKTFPINDGVLTEYHLLFSLFFCLHACLSSFLASSACPSPPFLPPPAPPLPSFLPLPLPSIPSSHCPSPPFLPPPAPPLPSFLPLPFSSPPFSPCPSPPFLPPPALPSPPFLPPPAPPLPPPAPPLPSFLSLPFPSPPFLSPDCLPVYFPPASLPAPFLLPPPSFPLPSLLAPLSLCLLPAFFLPPASFVSSFLPSFFH